jgi:hypothetical protein
MVSRICTGGDRRRRFMNSLASIRKPAAVCIVTGFIAVPASAQITTGTVSGS